jgi:hypothetical protein
VGLQLELLHIVDRLKSASEVTIMIIEILGIHNFKFFFFGRGVPDLQLSLHIMYHNCIHENIYNQHSILYLATQTLFYQTHIYLAISELLVTYYLCSKSSSLGRIDLPSCCLKPSPELFNPFHTR